MAGKIRLSLHVSETSFTPEWDFHSPWSLNLQLNLPLSRNHELRLKCRLNNPLDAIFVSYPIGCLSYHPHWIFLETFLFKNLIRQPNPLLCISKHLKSRVSEVQRKTGAELAYTIVLWGRIWDVTICFFAHNAVRDEFSTRRIALKGLKPSFGVVVSWITRPNFQQCS